jgi:hypothetical protein
MKQLTRAELLALPPATNLPTLGRAFGISEPVARERQRRGDFAAIGIRILQLGAQYRVVTADILRVLGIDPETQAAGSAPTEPAAISAPLPDEDTSDGKPTAGSGR